MLSIGIPSADKNYWLKRLDTQLFEPTNQNSIKVSKGFNPTNKEASYKTMGTSVINSPMSPPSLCGISILILTIRPYTYYFLFVGDIG